MEYRTISEIRSMGHNSPGNINSYIRSLAYQDHWSQSELEHILGELRSPHVDGYLPITSSYVIAYIKAYLCEHFNEISYWIIGKTFCAEDIRVVKFSKEESTHYVFCTVTDAHEIEHCMTLMSADISPEISSTSYLQEVDDFNEHRAYFSHLGFIPMTEEEIENAVIPELSATHIIDESTARFSSAIWFDEIQKKEIILAGLGGIGSWTALLLGRVKPARMFLYDNDVVELVNMAGQLYSSEDIGKDKVDATANNLAKFAAYHSVVALRELYTEQSPSADIMICGFDNMKARAIFFSNWLKHVKQKPEEERRHCLFIDGRLAAEELQVLCVTGNDTENINRYAKDFIFKDEEANETLCSYKQTSYMANMIGGFIVNLFTNFVANEICEGIRDLPFLTSYVGDTMVSKIEF